MDPIVQPPCIISRFLYHHGGNNTVNKQDLVDKMKTAVELLPVKQKEIIYLRFCEKHQHDAIARIMSLNPIATYRLLYKSLENLQQQLGAALLLDLILFLEYYFF